MVQYTKSWRQVSGYWKHRLHARSKAQIQKTVDRVLKSCPDTLLNSQTRPEQIAESSNEVA